MTTLVAALALALGGSPAAAQSIFERAAVVAGPNLAGLAVPSFGRTGTLAVPAAFRPMNLDAGSRDLANEAKAWSDKIAQVDKELDAEYDAYRAAPSADAQARIDASLQERSYYASVWRSMVGPAKDLPAADPRVTPILQALYGYLSPLPARADRLAKGKAASAKAVAAARDAADAAAARLAVEDRQALQAMALTGASFDEVAAKVPDARKASAQYMGWLRQAYDASAAWAKAVKIDSSWADQYAWVYKDYLENATLAKALSDKELGAAPAP